MTLDLVRCSFCYSGAQLRQLVCWFEQHWLQPCKHSFAPVPTT